MDVSEAQIGSTHPAIVHRAGAAAGYLVICDHAGRETPPDLGDLGLAPTELERHIGWDIGARALSLRLGEALGACTLLQRYSRLVIDCNRAPGAPDAIPPISDGTPIPGNARLTAEAAADRLTRVHAPYHAAIEAELAAREARGLTTRLLLIHSFTPQLRAGGAPRPWRFGVLHAGNSPLSDTMLGALRAEWGEVVGDNEPYRMDDTDYTAPRHAFAPGRDYLELEVRQDLLADEAGVAEVADTLLRALAVAERNLEGGGSAER